MPQLNGKNLKRVGCSFTCSKSFGLNQICTTVKKSEVHSWSIKFVFVAKCPFAMSL